MQKIIAFLDIGGRRYEIREDNYMGSTLGITDTVNAKIFLAKGVHRKVIVHELVHATSYEEGFYSVKWNREILADFFGSFGDSIIQQANIIEKARDGKN